MILSLRKRIYAVLRRPLRRYAGHRSLQDVIATVETLLRLRGDINDSAVRVADLIPMFEELLAYHTEATDHTGGGGDGGGNGNTGPTVNPLESFIIDCSDETTPLDVASAVRTFRIPYPFVMSERPRASLTTEQQSGDKVTINIKKNGVSIFGGTMLSIDNNERTSLTASILSEVTSFEFANDDEVTIDIVAIGDGLATGLKVALIGRQP